MLDFLGELALIFDKFPPVLLLVFCPLPGAWVGSYVMSKFDKKNKEYAAQTPRDFLMQVLVGWLVGGFGGAAVSPVINVPPPSVAFFAGAGGYIYMRIKLKEKLREEEKDDKNEP